MSPLSQYFEAVSLGALQGVAEFLPISSSGHLSLAQAVLDEATGRKIDPEGNRLLVIVLHVGTLGSILWSYRRDLWATATDVRYVTSVAVATAPLVVVALTPLKDRVEAMFAQPAVVGVCLLVTAGLLLAGQYLAVRRSDSADGDDGSSPPREVTLPVAAVIGAFQTLALLPGISRSGSTIAGGLMSGLSREEAARFSLMIGVPAIAGAGVLEAKSVLDAGVSLDSLPIGPLAAGAGTAFAVGVAAISLLRKAVSNDRLHWFAAYCAAVGAAALVWRLS